MSTATPDTHFDPSHPCDSFQASPAEARRDAQLLFVAQKGRLFVVKSYVGPGEADSQSAIGALQREHAAREAFTAVGVAVLNPAFGPVDHLDLIVDGNRERFPHALVFPFRTESTLESRLTPLSTQTLDTLREAGHRIVERHRAATDLAAIHSDGAPHNIFEDWVWFDFATEHRATDMQSAKAHEVWRFLCGTLALYPGVSSDDTLVAAFCEGYVDRDVLELLRKDRHGKPLWLAMLAHPIDLARLFTGGGDRLTRPRARRSLNRWLKSTEA